MTSFSSRAETYSISVPRVRNAQYLLITIGEDFFFSAILDDYQIIKELGQGGFGKVVLGKHKEDRKEVAIKFMDVSENRKLPYPNPKLNFTL